MMSSPKWRTTIVVGAFSGFTLLTTFTNKYVLSVQRFTYPTIFQSWQSGSLAVVLLSLHALGYIKLSVVNRGCFMKRIPAIGLFTGIIYTGSVALSKLPVPVFVVLHYLTSVVTFLTEWLEYKKVAKLAEGISLFSVVIAAEFMKENDPQFNSQGYLWMMGHCAFIILYKLYDDRISKLNNISEIEKIFYNAFGSLVLLLILSVVQGELYSALTFPSLYSRQFHVGCVGSAVFGSVLVILRYSMTTSELSSYICVVESANKVLLAVSSLAVFEASYTVNMVVSITVALSGGLVYSYLSFKATADPEKRQTHQVRDS